MTRSTRKNNQAPDPVFDPHFLPEHLKNNSIQSQGPNNRSIETDSKQKQNSHRVEPSVFSLQTVESLILIFAPILLIASAATRIPLILLPLLIIDALFVIHFPKITNAPTVAGTQIVGFIAVAFSLISPLFALSQLGNGGNVDILALPIVVTFISAFVLEGLRKTRESLIRSVSTSISLGLLIVCSVGFLMTWQLYSGVYFGFLSMCLIPLVFLGIWQFTVALWEKMNSMPVSRTIRLITGFAAVVVGSLISYALALSLSESVPVRLLDLFLTLIIVALSYFITFKHFPKLRSFSHSFVRSLLPLLLLGGAIYLVVVLIHY